MSSNSCPELDALVARVGLEQAMRTVRGWIGARDGEAFLRAYPPRAAPAPAPVEELPLAPPEEGACRCDANRGADCDCWEDYFRDEEDNGAGGLAAASSAPAVPPSRAQFAASGAGGRSTRQAEPAVEFARLQTQMLDTLRAAENDPTEPNIDALSAAMCRFEAAGGGEGDNYKYCLARYRELQEKHTK
jgi:hypothetical protein